jgi:hypothetical protein
MTQWVNAQIVPPLDVRELVDGERTGDLVEAAAAYSLRNLSSTYTGNVVDVRRSSDDAEDSFTAAEVADGTLVTWVGAGNDGFVSQWYDQSGNDNHATQGTDASQPKIVDGGSLVSGGIEFDGVNDKLSFDSSVSLSTNDFYFASVISILDGDREDITPVGNAAGNRFLISLDYDNDAAQMRANDGTFLTQPFTRTVPANETLISISTVSNTATLRCETISAAVFDTTGESFTLGSMGQITPSAYSKHSIKELIIYTSDQSDNRTAFEANIGETYGIDLPSGVDTGYDQVDGFVETWYDQSGNGIDLSQSVSSRQPLIVNAGTLVTNPEGSPSIECESTGHWLESGGNNTVGSDFSIYAVWTTPPALSTLLGYDDNRHMLRFGDDKLKVTINLSSTPYLEFTGLTVGGTNLVNINRHSDTISANFNSTISSGTATLSGAFVWNRIFNRSGTSASYNDYIGKASELIIYPSDQSANREAIEANINNQYDIY